MRLPWRVRNAIDGCALEMTQFAKPLEHIVVQQKPASIYLVAVGDISLHGSVGEHFLQAGAHAVLGDTLDVFKGADVRVGNLESVLSEEGREIFGGGGLLRADPRLVEVLNAAKFDLVTLANNHSLDYGEAGLRRCIDILERAGIRTCGVQGIGKGIAGSAIFTVGNVKIGALGFCDNYRLDPNEGGPPGPVSLSDNAVLDAISQLRPTVDVLVLQLHWGFEFGFYPPRSYRDRARLYAEKGADLVLCHHAHVPMGTEVWGKSLVAHGLGDFIFGDSRYLRMGHRWHNRSYMLRVGLSPDGVTDACMIPCEIDSGRSVKLSRGLRRNQMLGALSKVSLGLRNDRRLDDVERYRFALEALQLCTLILSADPKKVRTVAVNLKSPLRQQMVKNLEQSYGPHGKQIARVLRLLSDSNGKKEQLTADERTELSGALPLLVANENLTNPIPGRIP